jgi:hypothetical protein
MREASTKNFKNWIRDQKEADRRNERRSEAKDEHAKLVKEGGAMIGPRQLANHRTVTKRVSGGRSRVITRLRASIGFKNTKKEK